jgi:hypothetical protein
MGAILSKFLKVIGMAEKTVQTQNFISTKEVIMKTIIPG